jgi:hypothetical protein
MAGQVSVDVCNADSECGGRHFMNIKLRMAGLIPVCVMLLVVVGVAGAQTAAPAVETTVSLLSPYSRVDVPVYWDRNLDSVLDDETELVGTYNVLSIYDPLTFTWEPYVDEQIDPAQLSYRISLWQIGPWAVLGDWIDLEDPTTLSLEDGDYEILRTEHHWATNPSNQYTIGFNVFDEQEWVCPYCPTRVVVQPETYTQYLDPLTGVYEYEYQLIEGAPLQWSELFVIQRP